jgi:hypothetical protein
MTHPALEVAEFIEDQGYATLGTDLFVDRLPDLDNDCTVVYTTGGQIPDIYLPIPSPNFEILVRSDSAETAYERISNIVDDLHQSFNTTLVTGGNYYYSILLFGEINSLGRDEKGRIEYSANFNCKVRGR